MDWNGTASPAPILTLRQVYLQCVAAAFEFSVLGPVQVLRDGSPVAIRSRRLQQLLALLVVEAGSVVPIDRLIDGLWDERPPEGATNTLQVYVYKLRGLLEPERSPGEASGLVVTTGNGYVLMVARSAVDACRFDALIEDGAAMLEAGNHREAACTLREALGMWHGEPFSGLTGARIEPERRRLEESRSRAFEDWVDAESREGHPEAVVGQLQAAVLVNPLRERLHGQLMLALYQLGRQGDSLQAYRDAREALVSELGVEPGSELRELHARILAQDSSLSRRNSEDSDRPSTSTRACETPRSGRPRRRWTLISVPVVCLLAVGIGVLEDGQGRVPQAGSGLVRTDSVAVIDPQAGAVTADVRVRGAPSAIVATPGSVWVASGQTRTLTRIEPASGNVIGVVPLGVTPTGLATAYGDAVWVAEGLEHRLAYVRPTGNHGYLTSQLHLPGCCAGASVATFSQNVLYSADAGGLRRFEAARRHHVAQTVTGVGCSGVLHVGLAALVTDGWNTVSNVDALTGAVTRIRFGRRGSRPAQPTSMVWGNDRTWVTATRANQVVELNASNTAIAARIPVGRLPESIAYGGGSIWVANAGDGTVSRIDPVRGRVDDTIFVGHRITGLAYADGKLWASVEAVSPAGREPGLLAYDDHSQIVVSRVDGRDRRQLTTNGSKNVDPVWSPDGSQLLFSSNRGPSDTTYHFDIYAINPDGTGRTRVTYDLRAISVGPIWAPDGRHIAFWRGHLKGELAVGNVDLMDANGGHIRALSHIKSAQFAVHGWSPDSTRILFTSTVGNPFGPGYMEVMNADGTHIRRIGHPFGDDDQPTWSPNGVEIAYSSQEHKEGIYLTTVAGKQTIQLTRSTEAEDHLQPGWSPDGTAIAFAGTFEVPSDLFVMNADGTGLTRITSDLSVGSPTWRPTR